MTTSARLPKRAEIALTRFCREYNVTKTEAITRALDLLIVHGGSGAHPAFVAYQQLELVPEQPMVERKQRSSDAMRTAVRAKYTR